MKIIKSFEFYESLLENSSFFGNLDLMRTVDNWQWHSGQVNKTSLFLAFKGKNRDAFDFVEDVLHSSAGVIVAREEHKERAGKLQKTFANSLFIFEDPLAFLTRSAQKMLSLMPELLKIGITGSNGKTTTKETLASVLRASGRSFYASEGNYNSDIGMALSILQLTGEEKIAVFEMGINQEGDMDALVDLLRPQLALITHLSHAHVGPLGDFEGIVREKSKIARYAHLLFCPEIEALLLKQVDEPKAKIISYSLEDGKIKRERSSLQGEYFSWQGQEFFLSVVGEGALMATRAVIEIGQFLEIPSSAFTTGLAQVKLPYGRMQLVELEAGIDFLHDAYNANLSSLEVLLSFLKGNEQFFDEYCRTFFVFAGFKELGEETQEAHVMALKKILSLSWNTVFLIGEDLKAVSDEFAPHSPIHHLKNMESALNFFKDFFKSKDFVVLKGARYYALERVINLFQGDNEK